jgi:hypothetical protein
MAKRPKIQVIIPPNREEQPKAWVSIEHQEKIDEDGISDFTITESEFVLSLVRPKDGERIRVHTRGTWDVWCENCHFDKATDSVIRDMPPEPIAIVDPETGDVIGRAEDRPGYSLDYCKFEDVWEWQSIEVGNAPIRNGPAFGDEARVTEKLLQRYEEGKKAQVEGRKWESAQKQFNYHIGLFNKMIEVAKSNSECIVICRDMLDPDKNFAHNDPSFTNNGEPGKIVLGTYLNAVRAQLNYRERVKVEEQSVPRKQPDLLPFRLNWNRAPEELLSEVERLERHGILTFENVKGKERWIWHSSIQDLGLYLLRLQGLKWLTSRTLFTRTENDLQFEKWKNGKRTLRTITHAKIKQARDNANRGWQQKSGKAAVREVRKPSIAMEKLMEELPSPD